MRDLDPHSAFDYDVIKEFVAWNWPDHEHTRQSFREILHDLVETAIRENDEGAPADRGVRDDG